VEGRMQVRDFWSVPTVVGKRASWEPKQLLAKEPCCRLHWEEYKKIIGQNYSTYFPDIEQNLLKNSTQNDSATVPT
jgi:hypothetical protein